MAYRKGRSFGSGLYIEQDTILHRLALLNCLRQTHRPPNDMPFREPNRIAAKVLSNASVRPEESAPLLSRAANPADAYLPGRNEARGHGNLKASTRFGLKKSAVGM